MVLATPAFGRAGSPLLFQRKAIGSPDLTAHADILPLDDAEETRCKVNQSKTNLDRTSAFDGGIRLESLKTGE